MTTLTERLDKLPPVRRKKVEARARELVAKEMSLQNLRKTHKQTLVVTSHIGGKRVLCKELLS